MASTTDNDQQGQIDNNYNDGFNSNKSAYYNSRLNEQEKGVASPATDSDVSNSEKSSGWTVNIEDSKKQKKTEVKSSKKKIAIGGGVAATIAAVIFTMIFSASTLLVNMGEQIKNKIAGSTASVMAVKKDFLYRHKLANNMTSGSCSIITIRCKFKTMSDRQIKKLEKAGIKVNSDGSNFVGRKKVTSFEFEGRTITASNLSSELKKADFSSAMNKGMNPRFHAFASTAATKTFSKLGITKSKNLQPHSESKNMRASLREAVSGRTAAIEVSDLQPAGVDKEGNQLYKDPKNPDKILSKAEADKALASADVNYKDALSAKKAALEAGTGTAGKVVASSIKGTLLVGTGLVDSACTGYMIIRTASFAAKYLGALQMIRYSQVFLNTADAIKAGDATPEEVTYLNNILMSKNSQGKTAMDSRGWNYAMYGDVTPIPNLGKGADMNNLDKTSTDAVLASEVTNYVNGQITAKNTMADITRLVDGGGGTTEAADKACGFVKSAMGQTLIIGVGVAALAGCVLTTIFGVGAACLTGNTAISAGISVTLAVTMAILSPWLISLATDSILTGDENGNEAGNAIISGAGALNAQVGVASGLSYMTPESATEFAVVRQEKDNDFAMIDRYDNSPFNVSNPNTFAGLFATSIYSAMGKYNNTSVLANTVSSLSSILKLPSSLLSQNVKASTYADAGVCPDPDYTDWATDINCNPIVGQDNETLYADIDTVMDYMENSHIDPVTGNAKSDSYKNYLQYCVDRKSAIGSFEEGENPGSANTGKICGNKLSGDEKKMYSMFRAYQSLLVTNEGLDG